METAFFVGIIIGVICGFALGKEIYEPEEGYWDVDDGEEDDKKEEESSDEFTEGVSSIR